MTSQKFEFGNISKKFEIEKNNQTNNVIDYVSSLDLDVESKNIKHIKRNGKIRVIHVIRENNSDLYIKRVGEEITEYRRDIIKEGYLLAQSVDLNTAKHHISDDYVVSKHIDGGRIEENREEVDINNLINDYCKILLIGYADCGRVNMIVKENGEYNFIDLSHHETENSLHSMGYLVMKVMKRGMEYDTILFELIKLRLYDLVTSYEDEYPDTTNISSNVRYIKNKMPIMRKPKNDLYSTLVDEPWNVDFEKFKY